MRHSLFLFRGCRRPAARGPLLARVCAVPGLAPVFVAACCCAPPPNPHPALPLVVSRPPLASWCPRQRFCPPPPRGYALPGWLSRPRLPLLPLCLVVGRLLALTFAPPPPPPGSCFLGVGPCRSFSLVLLLLPCFSRAFGLGTCLVGFRFPPLAPAGAPPAPPGGCSWWSAVPRVLFCGAVVWGGLLCAARGVLLRRAVLLCGCLAVWCARLLCRWPSPVCVGHALSVGVARCSASPRCFVRCFVVCGAVVRCRVLRCFPCCSVVSWFFPLCLLGFAHLRVCAAWCCPPPPPPPPPPWFVCRAFCRFVLPRCAGLFCPSWCRVAACSVVLFGVRRAVPCCAVSCCAPRVAWCWAALPRAAASCCVLCRARWCCAVLSCVAPFAGVLRPGALCCAVPLCAVAGCFVPSGVRWRCAVGCMLCCAVVCCCALCCAFGRGAWLRCAVLSSLWLAVSFWSRCPVLCCAVPPGAVLGPVASCCAVWCFAAVHRAVGVALCCVVSRSVVPLPAVACPRVLCGASGVLCFAACCAVLLCFLLCLGVWCLGALCCAVRVVSGGLVGVCAPVWCAVSLGAVMLCVASCCFVRCSAVAHCAVCVVLCCFCSRCLVLVRAVSCPRVLCRAVGCCAVWCGALLWCPVLCALRCVCFAVVLWCVLFLLLSVVLLAPCGVTPVHFQNPKKMFPIFKNRKNCFPLVGLVYPVLPACNNTTH